MAITSASRRSGLLFFLPVAGPVLSSVSVRFTPWTINCVTNWLLFISCRAGLETSNRAQARQLTLPWHRVSCNPGASDCQSRTSTDNLSCRGRSHSSISLKGWVAFSTLRAASSVSTQASWNMCTIAIIHTYRAPLSIRPACKVLQLAVRNFEPTQLRLRDVGVTAHPPDGWRLFSAQTLTMDSRFSNARPMPFRAVPLLSARGLLYAPRLHARRLHMPYGQDCLLDLKFVFGMRLARTFACNPNLPFTAHLPLS
jgi:hypothetical protein